jgi:Asp-tRNA(Asn)/Glu-tRNA(Gln) amidotransferase A subunit family amidase
VPTSCCGLFSLKPSRGLVDLAPEQQDIPELFAALADADSERTADDDRDIRE